MIGAAPAWRTVSASVRGSQHEVRGAPNEDAVGILDDGFIAAVAVADGHGSQQCFRSDVGSRLAVELALELAAERVEDLSGPTTTVAEHMEAIGESLIDRWKARVRRHVEEEPLTDDEVEALAGARVEYAYGTTILLAGCSADAGFALQLGDGHIVLVGNDGTASLAFPNDGLAANETYSLCLDNASDYLQVRAWPLDGAHPRIITASTDGWGSAFESAEWYTEVGGQLLEHLRTSGVDYISAHLEGWLGRTAHEFGDDTTLAALLADSVDDEETKTSEPVPDEERSEGDVDLQTPPAKRRRWLLPLAVTSSLVIGLATGLLLARAGPAESAVSLATPVGLIEVAGDRAELVSAQAAGSGPEVALVGTSTWRVGDASRLTRTAADGSLFTLDLAGDPEFVSLAADGERVFAASRSGAVVYRVLDESCTEDGCSPECLTVVDPDSPTPPVASCDVSDASTEAPSTSMPTTVPSSDTTPLEQGEG